MRQSQAQIGVISAPICAFCHHSFGGFSIVSVQACPLFSDSGSKLGQKLLGGKWRCRLRHEKIAPPNPKNRKTACAVRECMVYNFGETGANAGKGLDDGRSGDISCPNEGGHLLLASAVLPERFRPSFLDCFLLDMEKR